MNTITPAELNEQIRQDPNVDLIDVRTPAEFGEVHATAARNLPLDTLAAQEFLNGRNDSSARPLYVICKAGSRAAQACKQLANAGFKQAINVEGGTEAWVNAGLPVKRGRKAMSLERQVRIAAGLLVLTGVVLGTWVNPALFGVSAFVGAGLVFAGITDWCGMGMLIAKMPWNQRSGEACCS